MPSPQRGEVWLVDLGMTAKVRPALVISVPAEDIDRALATLVPTPRARANPDSKPLSQFLSCEWAYSTRRISSRFHMPSSSGGWEHSMPLNSLLSSERSVRG
jgi:hypothetical protein